DGFEAARHIRNLEAEGPGTRIPIIALTGLALEVHRGRCLDAGMDHVLTKPVRLQTLRDLLATTSN
ncbi:MAG: response regulator, partial [Acidobacteriota bacterium]